MTDLDSLRDAAVAALKRAATIAEDRVYSPRDWPTNTVNYPCIIVRTPEENGAGIGRNGPPAFTTAVTLEVSGRLEAKTEAAADAAGRQLLQQMKDGLLRNGQFMYSQQIQQFPSFASRLDISSESGTHFADILFKLTAEIFQVYDPTIDAAGFPLPGAALEEVKLVADLISPADRTGTYPDPDFPQAVQPAPRTEGPDGRPEGVLDIKFE